MRLTLIEELSFTEDGKQVNMVRIKSPSETDKIRLNPPLAVSYQHRYYVYSSSGKRNETTYWNYRKLNDSVPVVVQKKEIHSFIYAHHSNIQGDHLIYGLDENDEVVFYSNSKNYKEALRKLFLSPEKEFENWEADYVNYSDEVLLRFKRHTEKDLREDREVIFRITKNGLTPYVNEYQIIGELLKLFRA